MRSQAFGPGRVPTSGSGARVTLLGRADECALLDDLVAAVRGGESRSLVLHGEAGIGKTALLEHLIASAPGFTVVRAAGVELEMELPFAGLHQLCAPLLDGLEQLPGPQREALRIVFGMAGGPAPERFLVGLAVLSLVSEAAERRPLLCIVDDAQWLDRTSALALAFVTRRLLAEPVGIVFAARLPGDELRQLPELEVRGLVNGDASALLGSAVRFALDRPVRDRIVAETRGNPLALLELPRGLTPTQLAGGFGIPEARDLPSRIEGSYLRRLEALPEAARRLLLVAAAEPVGDPLLLRGACERLAIASSVVDSTDGLLAVQERVTFPHPLVRSAVYRSATGAERRAAHLALGQATDADADPDRRAWHLAGAAAEPDEAVARELERSAGRAQARGGLAAAAAFLQRAVVLTADPAERAGRALAAAQASLAAGAFDAARGLLAAADTGPLDALGQARADRLQAEIAFAQNRGGEAPLLLLRAAGKLEAHDVRLARDTYLDAWTAGLFAGRLARTGGSMPEVARAMATAPGPDGPPRPSDLLLDGLAAFFTDRGAAATAVLRRAVAAFTSPDITPEDVLRWGFVASRAANLLWDCDGALEISGRAVELAREAGALELLGAADNACGQAAAFGGDFATAALMAAEVEAVKEATRTRISPYAAIALAALRGRDAEATELIDGVTARAVAGGQGTAVQYARWATACLMNGLGRYDEALAAAQETDEQAPELYIAWWALGELAEAAARTERHDLARSALERLGRWVDDSGADWGLGLRARVRALVSEGGAAETHHREAVERLGRTRLRPELARSHLLYGEWLRREGRRADARTQLHAAHDLCLDIGMESFAQRARSELLATGARLRRRDTETRDELTPQELQITRLACDGLSNAEIGARLFLSPRTVEWHLRNVFTKLGIRSRHDLSRALPAGAVQTAGPAATYS